MRTLFPIVLASGLISQAAAAETFSADVWADNWFQFQVAGETVAEDSVPITTERSFNAESFSFQAERPLTIGVIAKDFKENDTGLEYIGTNRQQMGDGGLILQVKDARGATVAVSDDGWQCLVIHTAPLDRSCARERNPIAGQGPCTFEALEEPAGWSTSGFDAAGWAAAHIYSERDVKPKDGYDRIRWDSAARLIWGPDLHTANTLICRMTVE